MIRSTIPANSVSGQTSPYNAGKRYSERNSQMELQLAYVGEQERDRLRNYRLFMSFYEGRHWSNADPNFGVDPETQTHNFCAVFVDKKTQFLVKDGFSTKIPEAIDPAGDLEGVELNFVKAALDEEWEYNDPTITGYEMVQQGTVYGDTFLKVVWDEGDMYTPPHVAVRVIPANWVFPIWESEDARARMVACRIIFPMEIHRDVPTRGFFGSGMETRTEVVIYEETWTADWFEIRHDGNLVAQGPNPIGIIPIVHIKNRPNANGHYGYSDLRDIVPLQRTLNECATDTKLVMEYHGSPRTVVIGTSADNLVSASDMIWSLPKDSTIQTLEIQGDLKANIAFYELTKNTMCDIASVPNQLINPTQNISNTPGVALHLAFGPAVEDRMIREQMYGRGLREVNLRILAWRRLMDPKFGQRFDALQTRQPYRTEIVWEEPLARDETLQLENDIQELDMGITTRVEILMRRRGIGQKEAMAIVAAADADTEARLAVTQTQQKDPFGKRRRPDPVVQGDRISNNASEE